MVENKAKIVIPKADKDEYSTDYDLASEDATTEAEILTKPTWKA